MAPSVHATLRRVRTRVRNSVGPRCLNAGMEDEPDPPPDEEVPVQPGGVDQSDDAPMAALNAALTNAQRTLNLAEALRAEVALAAFDALLIEEQARGVPVERGDFVEKAFALHLSGYLQVSPAAARGFVEAARSAWNSLP